MSLEYKKEIKVPNKYGIHARPATKMVEISNNFPGEIFISKDGMEVNGKSVISIMTLGAEQGSMLLIRAIGENSQDVVESLATLINSGFGEEM